MISNYLSRIQSYIVAASLAVVVATCTSIQPAHSHSWTSVAQQQSYVNPLLTRVHSWAITECSDNIIYDEAVLLDAWVDDTMAVAYWAEAYDTNGDGVKDIIAMSFITGFGTEPNRKGQLDIHHDPNPSYWMVDRNYDDVPDEAYIDVKGLGDCSDIKFLKFLGGPNRPDFDSRGDAVV